MFCNTCGARLPAGSRFCQQCGYAQPAADRVRRLTCPACGGPVPLTAAPGALIACPACRSTLQVHPGQGLSVAAAREFGSVAGVAFGQALRQNRLEARREREMARADRALRSSAYDLHQFFLGTMAVEGLLLSFAPSLAFGSFGLVMVGFGLVAAVLTLWVDVQRGKALGRSIAFVVFTGVVIFGVSYGIMWYFTVYLAHQPLTFPIPVHTPVPTRVH